LKIWGYVREKGITLHNKSSCCICNGIELPNNNSNTFTLKTIKEYVPNNSSVYCIAQLHYKGYTQELRMTLGVPLFPMLRLKGDANGKHMNVLDKPIAMHRWW
jgi:hypothetical protein